MAAIVWPAPASNHLGKRVAIAAGATDSGGATRAMRTFALIDVEPNTQIGIINRQELIEGAFWTPLLGGIVIGILIKHYILW